MNFHISKITTARRTNVPDVYASARATMLGHNFRGEGGEDFTRVRVHLLHV